MTHAWTDSYPYNSISIYAFHPMYADIRQMGTLKDKEAVSKFSKKQKELNSLPAIDYEAVNQTKWEFFNLLFRQEGEKVLASKGFKDFFETNKEWLQPYAVFSYLRDAYKTPNFRKWPRHSVYQAEDIEKMCQPGTADYPHISLYYYIQYHLHLQLLSATEYARQHGVVLRGIFRLASAATAWKPGQNLITSISTDKRVLRPMISRSTGKTGDSPHTTGMSWKKTDTAGG